MRRFAFFFGLVTIALLLFPLLAAAEKGLSVDGFSRYDLPGHIETTAVFSDEGMQSILMQAKDGEIWRANNFSIYLLSNASPDSISKTNLASHIVEGMAKAQKGRVITSTPFVKTTVNGLDVVLSDSRIAFAGFVGRITIYGFSHNAGLGMFVFVSSDADYEYWKPINEAIVSGMNMGR